MPFRKTPFRGSSAGEGLFGSSRQEESSAQDAIVAHVDGGARGNPGPSGYGVHIADAQGKTIAELSEYLGNQTNNFAEYSGLLAALEWALAQGHKSLKVVSDSELMVKQIRGEYKVKSESLQDIYQEAKALIRKLDSFSIRHVLRHQNKDADRLANEAMDKGMGRAPAPATPSRSAATEQVQEVNGIVRGGVVEFLGTRLPDGIMVKIRPAAKR
jgi:ribonuclease HI